jgi:hypothetical protein
MDRPSVFKLEGDVSTATDMSTNAPSILAINGVFCTLTVIVGVLRTYVRSVMLKTFGTDDWFILAATVCYNHFATDYRLHYLLGSDSLVPVQVQVHFHSPVRSEALCGLREERKRLPSKLRASPLPQFSPNNQTRFLLFDFRPTFFLKRQPADLLQDMQCRYLYLLYWRNKARSRDAYGFHIYRRNDQVETLAVFPFNNCHCRNIIHQDFRRIVSTPFGTWKGI